MTPIEVLKMLKSKIDEAEFYKSNYVLQTNDVEAINEALRIHAVVGRSEQLVCNCQGCGEVKKIEYCEKCYAENLPDIAN
jgi:hypothetical protein